MILNLFLGNSEQSMFYQNTLLFVYKKDGNMRFKIMFGTTFIILLYLLFYPRTTYLNKYDKSITVDYSNFKLDDNCDWKFKLDNDNIKLSKSYDNKWVFSVNNSGKTRLTFKCNNEKNIYEIVYILKVEKNKIYWISGDAKGLLDFPNLY